MTFWRLLSVLTLRTFAADGTWEPLPSNVEQQERTQADWLLPSRALQSNSDPIANGTYEIGRLCLGPLRVFFLNDFVWLTVNDFRLGLGAMVSGNANAQWEQGWTSRAKCELGSATRYPHTKGWSFCLSDDTPGASEALAASPPARLLSMRACREGQLHYSLDTSLTLSNAAHTISGINVTVTVANPLHPFAPDALTQVNASGVRITAPSAKRRVAFSHPQFLATRVQDPSTSWSWLPSALAGFLSFRYLDFQQDPPRPDTPMGLWHLHLHVPSPQGNETSISCYCFAAPALASSSAVQPCYHQRKLMRCEVPVTNSILGFGETTETNLRLRGVIAYLAEPVDITKVGPDQQLALQNVPLVIQFRFSGLLYPDTLDFVSTGVNYTVVIPVLTEYPVPRLPDDAVRLGGVTPSGDAWAVPSPLIGPSQVRLEEDPPCQVMSSSFSLQRRNGSYFAAVYDSVYPSFRANASTCPSPAKSWPYFQRESAWYYDESKEDPHGVIAFYSPAPPPIIAACSAAAPRTPTTANSAETFVEQEELPLSLMPILLPLTFFFIVWVAGYFVRRSWPFWASALALLGLVLLQLSAAGVQETADASSDTVEMASADIDRSMYAAFHVLYNTPQDSPDRVRLASFFPESLTTYEGLVPLPVEGDSAQASRGTGASCVSASRETATLTNSDEAVLNSLASPYPSLRCPLPVRRSPSNRLSRLGISRPFEFQGLRYRAETLMQRPAGSKAATKIMTSETVYSMALRLRLLRSPSTATADSYLDVTGHEQPVCAYKDFPLPDTMVVAISFACAWASKENWGLEDFAFAGAAPVVSIDQGDSATEASAVVAIPSYSGRLVFLQRYGMNAGTLKAKGDPVCHPIVSGQDLRPLHVSQIHALPPLINYPTQNRFLFVTKAYPSTTGRIIELGLDPQSTVHVRSVEIPRNPLGTWQRIELQATQLVRGISASVPFDKHYSCSLLGLIYGVRDTKQSNILELAGTLTLPYDLGCGLIGSGSKTELNAPVVEEFTPQTPEATLAYQFLNLTSAARIPLRPAVALYQRHPNGPPQLTCASPFSQVQGERPPLQQCIPQFLAVQPRSFFKPKPQLNRATQEGNAGTTGPITLFPLTVRTLLPVGLATVTFVDNIGSAITTTTRTSQPSGVLDVAALLDAPRLLTERISDEPGAPTLYMANSLTMHFHVPRSTRTDALSMDDAWIYSTSLETNASSLRLESVPWRGPLNTLFWTKATAGVPAQLEQGVPRPFQMRELELQSMTTGIVVNIAAWSSPPMPDTITLPASGYTGLFQLTTQPVIYQQARYLAAPELTAAWTLNGQGIGNFGTLVLGCADTGTDANPEHYWYLISMGGDPDAPYRFRFRNQLLCRTRYARAGSCWQFAQKRATLPSASEEQAGIAFMMRDCNSFVFPINPASLNKPLFRWNYAPATPTVEAEVLSIGRSGVTTVQLTETETINVVKAVDDERWAPDLQEISTAAIETQVVLNLEGTGRVKTQGTAYSCLDFDESP